MTRKLPGAWCQCLHISGEGREFDLGKPHAAVPPIFRIPTVSRANPRYNERCVNKSVLKPHEEPRALFNGGGKDSGRETMPARRRPALTLPRVALCASSRPLHSLSRRRCSAVAHSSGGEEASQRAAGG
jgi:hypothetical protein